jgi:hypothetical protein
MFHSGQQLAKPIGQFRQMKEVRGVRRFRRRGFAACASEWQLICTTHTCSGCGAMAAGRRSPTPAPPPRHRTRIQARHRQR